MFGLRKLETSFNNIMRSIYWYIEPFWCDLPACRTDGETFW